jgi:hypothetical protein
MLPATRPDSVRRVQVEGGDTIDATVSWGRRLEALARQCNGARPMTKPSTRAATEYLGMEKSKSLKARLGEELRNYLLVTAYLFVCFAVLLLYRSAILSGVGEHVAPFGTALVKALVLGKFLLIGQAAGVGTRVQAGTVLRRIAIRTLSLAALLVVLTIVEEIVIGLVHKQPVAQSLAGFFGDALPEKLAGCLVMVLVLLPLVAATELRRALGPAAFASLLKGPPRGRD